MLAAVFFGVLAFIFTYQQIKQERSKIMNSAVRVRLIRMKADVSEGDKLMESDIEMYEAMRFVNAAANSLEIPWDRRTDVIGSPLRSIVRKGDILTWRDFKEVFTKVNTGLPAQTRSGWRAISIPVSQVSSVSGLIRPNNFVDVIGTFHFPDAKGDSSLDTVTMTILQRVKVLATGSDIGYAQQNGAQPNASAAGRSYSAVTLELTPKEVEMIIFAQQKGSLTLSLRSYEDPNITTDVQSVDWAYLQQHIKEYTSEREQLLRKTSGY
jgi:pilus assembly protein CpaB